MAKAKGTPKTGGRKPGSVNKTTADIREKFRQLLDGVGIESMIADLSSIKPNERLNVLMGMAEYIVPKLARTELKHEADEGLEGFSISIKRNRDTGV